MERFNFRRMGLLSMLSAIAGFKQAENKTMETLARGFLMGGYSNRHHGWAGKGRKVKGWQRPGGAQNRRAERRARA